MSAKPQVRMHVLEHVQYPTSKKQLVEACNMMSDVPQGDKDWFAKDLPDRTYASAAEVLKALNL